MLQSIGRILSRYGLGARWPNLGGDQIKEKKKGETITAEKQPGSKTDTTQWHIRVRRNIQDDSEIVRLGQ